MFYKLVNEFFHFYYFCSLEGQSQTKREVHLATLRRRVDHLAVYGECRRYGCRVGQRKEVEVYAKVKAYRADTLAVVDNVSLAL